MVDGLITTGRLHAADESIGRILTEGQASGVVGAPEVTIHGLPNEGGERNPPASGLVLEFAVGRFEEAQIRRHISRHRDITIPQVERPGKTSTSRASRGRHVTGAAVEDLDGESL